MFTSWNNEGKLTEGSIRQANEHLLLVNQRVIELEQRILEQKELLDRREQEHVERLRALACKKDAEIKLLQQELTTARQQTARSEGIIKERDVQIAFLLHRCSYLDEAASYAPLLDQLSQCLKNAFAAPSPKIQTVNPTWPLAHKTNCCTLKNKQIDESSTDHPIKKQSNMSGTDHLKKEQSNNQSASATIAPIRTKPIL